MASKTQIKLQALTKALIKAKMAMAAADVGDSNDGGTCNFDSPRFTVPKIPAQRVMKAAEDAGVLVFCLTGKSPKTYQVGVPYGQANRRTLCAKAGTDALVAEKLGDIIPGCEVYTYYHMD